MAEIEKNAAEPPAKTEQSDSKETKKAEKAAAKEAKAVAKKDSSNKKQKPKGKKNIFARIGSWFKDLRKEFKKVVWPDRKKVFNNTLVVLAVILIGSVLIGLIDTGLLQLMKFLMGLSS